MPRVKPGERIRARKPKTRTGCKTCKIRRVKCDEVKPSCQRCTSTGRKCDGYDDVFIDVHTASLVPRSSLSDYGSLQERRAVYFFRERTGPQLAGFYECSFWRRIILQAADTDTCVRHGLVALAAVHEDYECGRTTEGRNSNFALRQYNLAISKHLEDLVSGDGPTLDKYLAPCILFVCIEMLQRHYGSALSLVMQAVKIFYEASPQQQTASVWPIDIFESILSRLQSQAVGLAGLSAIGVTVPPLIKPAVLYGIPDKFSSVAEAKDVFEFYTNTHILSRFTVPKFDAEGAAEPVGPFTDSDRRKWLENYQQFAAAFDALLSSSYDGMSQHERNAADVLQIRRLLLHTSLDIMCRQLSGNDDQYLWDQYNPIFQQTVDLAECVVNRMRPSASSGERKNMFTLELGIVGPLYDIARRCRDPTIRRKAISLLYANPCQEGLWDSVLAARVAERAMQLEEQGQKDITASTEIRDEQRISTVIPSFDLEHRRALISFSRYDDSCPSHERRRIEEVIEW